MQMETRMPAKPRFHTWMFVCSIIVDDEMQIKTCRGFIVYLLEESNKLLVSVTRHAVTYYFSIKHAQSSKQRGCAIAFVIMCLCPAASFFHGQSRLCSVKRLNLALLINTQHQCFIRRIHIQANNVMQFLDEPLVTA